jgi:ribose transport system substrate-binding protein
MSGEDTFRVSRRELLKRGGLLGVGAMAGATLLAACSEEPRSKSQPQGAPKSGERRKVIFVTHDNNPFFVPVIKGLQEFGKLRGWETQFLGPPKHDVQQTVEMQANAIAAKPDAVGFTRVDTTSFDANIKRAQQQGIFVILFNTASAGHRSLGLAYVGQEFISAGQASGLQAAKHAHEITGKKDGLIVLGTIAPGHSALEQRMEGARQGIAQYNKQNGTNFTTEVLATATDQNEAIGKIDAKWQKDSNRIVGFAHADFGHWFTGIWIEDRGLKGKVANGGFDLVQGALEAIKSGTAQWSIGQNPYAQGWVTSALIDMQLEASYPPFDYDTGAEVVDASNIDAVTEREKRFSK